MGRLGFVIFFALSAAFSATPAASMTSTTPVVEFNYSPAGGLPGTLITITGTCRSGNQPADWAVVSLFKEPPSSSNFNVSVSITPGRDGALRGSVHVPDTAAPGNYRLSGNCGISDVAFPPPVGLSHFRVVSGSPSKPGVVRGNRNWFERNELTTGVADSTFAFGTSTDHPIAGDWDGNNTTTPGVTRVAGAHWEWLLRNSNTSGPANDLYDLVYGMNTDIPVVGDWDGNGTVTPGVVRVHGAQWEWLLRNSQSSGNADIDVIFGLATDRPVVGDWNGDGTTTIGVVRGPNEWLLQNANTAGPAKIDIAFGTAGDVPVPGDWDGNGTTTVGMVRGNTWLLRNSNSGGNADRTFGFGSAGDTFVTGSWTG